jgi:hypothetical protein
MEEFALIACRVSLETKDRVRRVADREGITESALLRQLVEVMLRKADSDGAPVLTPPERVNRDARLNLRLEPQDWRLLKERSKARCMASATYASLALRSHLRGGAPLPKAEYLALTRSIEGLAAVGRNLNQMARALNRGGRTEVPGRQEVMTMLKVAEGLRDHFKAFLEANQKAWEDGSAETTH